MCTAALAILDRLDVVDVDTLAWWLAERQLPNGGLNGRPEKLEDVSYVFVVSFIHLWWPLSSSFSVSGRLSCLFQCFVYSVRQCRQQYSTRPYQILVRVLGLL